MSTYVGTMPEEDKLVLSTKQAEVGMSAEELAHVIVERLGLVPRKKNATEHTYKLLLELYERQKQSVQMKDPALAIMTVEEMAMYTKISRQTMYEYLGRWLHTGMLQKVSFLDDKRKLVVGYRLCGSTLEDAFGHMRTLLHKHVELTGQYIVDLQKRIKNEKISASMKRK